MEEKIKRSLFILEGLDIGRKGELKFLVISTKQVFIFNMEYFGNNAFKWEVLGKLIFILLSG